MKRILAIGIILLFIGMSRSSSTGFNAVEQSTTPLNGKTLYVGGSGPGNYTKIQDAIDNASDGDTVFVYNGIYYEYKIVIEYSINLTGENKYNTIINGCGAIDVLRVFVDGVNISGFTITNADCEWEGIYIGANYSTITNNIITNNGIGITINYSSSHSNIITDNIISDNYDYGIGVSYSSNNIIYHNDFINNSFMNACDMGSNTWDDEYPSGGNYWDDYTGNDSDGDGIGDTPYPIPGGDNEDRYPLMEPYFNDTTPPVTTHSLDPPDPDGENGYYVSDVEVTLNATDNESGVKAIFYRISEGEWINQSGDIIIFIIDNDCLNNGIVEYYAVDNAGNQESIKSFYISMDQIPPKIIELSVKIYLEGGWWNIDFIVVVKEECSNSNRVEIYINNGLQEIIQGSGPDYVFTIQFSEEFFGRTISVYCYDRAGNYDTGNLTLGPIIKAFLFGKIDGLIRDERLGIFNASKVNVIRFFPYSSDVYNSGETFLIIMPKIGFLNSNFIIGLYKIIIF